ncbi:MAG: DUF934 domain-containing protein [Marinicaulis sp.]|nr:DUF934 domain-containing protein [Marinicaulis sp.]NNL90515.1 DUF934 domain-containing protein [Marinicaulis sp.]
MTLLKYSSGQFFPSIAEGQVEVALHEWRENPQVHADATALVISNDENLADLVCDISGFDTVVLEYPSFLDGRAFSQARILRERLHYSGEIRARGDVLRDQIAFMVRCGINGFEFADGAASATEAVAEFTNAYQAGVDEAAPIWRRRHRRARAA